MFIRQSTIIFKDSVNNTLTLVFFCLFVKKIMKLIKTIHYTYSISEFYLNSEKGDIIELKHLPEGRIKKYKLSKEDNRLTTLKQLKVNND